MSLPPIYGLRYRIDDKGNCPEMACPDKAGAERWQATNRLPHESHGKGLCRAFTEQVGELCHERAVPQGKGDTPKAENVN